MKANDFSAVLRAIADTLSTVGATRAGDGLRAFAAVFEVTPTATVAAVLKRLGAAEASEAGRSPTLADVSAILVAAEPIFLTIAKPPVRRDVDLVTRFLRQRPASSVADVVAAASIRTPPARVKKGKARSTRSDLVDHYLTLLEETRGDDLRFGAVFNQLKSDESVGSSEIAALAKAFTGVTVKSRSDGLKRIWSRHQDLLTARAKAAATAGRSAA